jgi:hypothetical protein
MKYVVDSSVSFKWLVIEPLSDKADCFAKTTETGSMSSSLRTFFPAR